MSMPVEDFAFVPSSITLLAAIVGYIIGAVVSLILLWREAEGYKTELFFGTLGSLIWVGPFVAGVAVFFASVAQRVF